MEQSMQVLTSHATSEWYTPARYIELARQVLGAIDLDPAGSAVAQGWIQAETYWTESDDGLPRSWTRPDGSPARTWLNPPYGKINGKSQMEVWSRKLEQEYLLGNVAAAILLVNASNGYVWYERLWNKWPVCCAYERIRFIQADGTQGGQCKRGNVFCYFGPDLDKFEAVFSPIGRIILPSK